MGGSSSQMIIDDLVAALVEHRVAILTLRQHIAGVARIAEAFVAEAADSVIGNSVVGMATCSQRTITGWNGPVVFLQDLFVEPAYREHGIAKALMARVAALACDLGSPIVELTVRADNPAQKFYLRSGFEPVPQCQTYVLAGAALAALAEQDKKDLALAG